MKARPGTLGLPLLLLAGAALFSACSTTPPPASGFGGGREDPFIHLSVTNLNFMDATLWAVTPGDRRKLGVVVGKREAVYDLSLEYFTDLQIEIDILSGPRCLTESLPVNPGDHLELIIDVELVNSPLCRYPPGP